MCLRKQVVEYWTFSLFFCVAELWGSVVISVLFWSLANEVCNVTEARAVYPLMGIAANVALVRGGKRGCVRACVPACVCERVCVRAVRGRGWHVGGGGGGGVMRGGRGYACGSAVGDRPRGLPAWSRPPAGLPG